MSMNSPTTPTFRVTKKCPVDYTCVHCKKFVGIPVITNCCHVLACDVCAKLNANECPECAGNPTPYSGIIPSIMTHKIYATEGMCSQCDTTMTFLRFHVGHKESCVPPTISCVGKSLGCTYTDREDGVIKHEANCKHAYAAPLVLAEKKKRVELQMKYNALMVEYAVSHRNALSNTYYDYGGRRITTTSSGFDAVRLRYTTVPPSEEPTTICYYV